VRWTYRRVKDGDGHRLAPREYSRLARAVVRWDAELTDIDPTRVNPRLEEAMRTRTRAVRELSHADADVRRRGSAALSEAETAFLSVLDEEPGNPHALEQMGLIRLAQGRKDEARAYFVSTLEHARENLRPPARLELAALAEEAGDVDGAMRQLARLLAEDSEHPLATDALARLAALRRARGDVGIADELDAQVAARRQPPPE